MKTQVEVKALDAVRDIRLGLSDLALMEKYRLTDRGLGSLFRKLVAAGLLKVSELEQRDPTFTSTIPLKLQDSPKRVSR
ncbi:MAG: hypothetical protein LDL33_12735 [Desulfomonile sp.]|nr:hypothetical protein [Desulfomonile sp.]